MHKVANCPFQIDKNFITNDKNNSFSFQIKEKFDNFPPSFFFSPLKKCNVLENIRRG